MGSEAHPLHIFFFPSMGHGHMIPMVHIAKLFAARGTKSTVILTPVNAPLFADTIARGREAGLDIGIQIIKFPSVQAGLPEGCERVDSLTSEDMFEKFFKAILMLPRQFEQLIEEHRPDCVVSDMFLTWTTAIAKKHGIPRLVFHGTGFFPHCLSENIKRYTPHRNIKSDSEVFVVPGLPDPIEMTLPQLPLHVRSRTPFTDLMDKVEETEKTSFGVLINSFDELEPTYAEYYRKEMGRRAWSIGPVSLYDKSIMDKTHGGKMECLKWLDSKKADSVLYISFGSIARFCPAQMLEIAIGLEASNVQFMWRVMAGKEDIDQVLPEGFEERMRGKGFIIRDWAPQVLILEHPAVGGFMTHCGWNSTLEATSAGLPMITWPLFAEQFENEKLVTQVLKTGISAGNDIWNSWIKPEKVTVRMERVEEVVTQLMGDGEAAQDMRRRARKLREEAKAATGKGGSSYTGLTSLIEELTLHSLQRRSPSQLDVLK